MRDLSHISRRTTKMLYCLRIYSFSVMGKILLHDKLMFPILTPGLIALLAVAIYLLATEPLFLRAVDLVTKGLTYRARGLLMRANIEAYVIRTKIDPSAQMQMAREICADLGIEMPESD